MHLSPYQVEAVNRFLENPVFADYDVPGAGKTAVAANAISELDRYPALITVPAHLVPQWQDELIRWGVPEDEIAACPRGTKPAERKFALQGTRAITLVSYNSWASKDYQRLILDKKWQSYTLDEAHRIRKYRLGKQGVGQAISWLRAKTRSKHWAQKTPVWLLSGTPIVKDATDVFPLMHLANPYRYRSRRDFANEWCHTTQTPYSLEVGRVRDREKFNELLARYSIRRTYSQIPELRDLQRRDVPMPLTMEAKQRQRHKFIRQNYRDPETDEPLDSPSAMIHALRRITLPLKAEAAVELVEDHPGRWLFFVWYKDSGRYLRSYLEQKLKRKVGYIDGSVSERNREAAVAYYRNDPNGILVATIAALSEGGNYQQGYQVAFLEQHYLSTDNDQAVKRVFRRGQKRPVLVFWLHCRGSFDMHVKRVADKRSADIEFALNEFLDELT
jgi:SNF2 family DNA or RNA helicase